MAKKDHKADRLAIALAILLFLLWLFLRRVKHRQLGAVPPPEPLQQLVVEDFAPDDFSGLQAPSLPGITSPNLPGSPGYGGITSGTPNPPGFGSITSPSNGLPPISRIGAPLPSGTFSIRGPSSSGVRNNTIANQSQSVFRLEGNYMYAGAAPIPPSVCGIYTIGQGPGLFNVSGLDVMIQPLPWYMCSVEFFPFDPMVIAPPFTATIGGSSGSHSMTVDLTGGGGKVYLFTNQPLVVTNSDDISISGVPGGVGLLLMGSASASRFGFFLDPGGFFTPAGPINEVLILSGAAHLSNNQCCFLGTFNDPNTSGNPAVFQTLASPVSITLGDLSLSNGTPQGFATTIGGTSFAVSNVVNTINPTFDPTNWLIFGV